MSNLLMNRKEVAEYLGVTPQTVSNWINRGLIKSAQDEGRAVYVSRADIEKFADKLRMTSDDEEKLKEYVIKKHEERKYWDDLWDDVNVNKINKNQLNSYIEIIQLGVMKAFEVSGNSLSEREKGIIKMALSLKPTTEIAKEFGITRSMVNHLMRFTLAKLRRLQEAHSYNDLVKENAQLREQVSIMTNKNNQLKNLFIAAIQGVDCQDGTDINNEKLEILATRIENLRLSVRLTNRLTCIGDTLGDVIQYRYDDLCKLRGMGKKSMTELVELLNVYGLKFGNKRIE